LKHHLYLQGISYFLLKTTALAPRTEEDTTVEGTRVLYGLNEILDFVVPLFAALRKKLDVCLDYTGPALHFTTEPIWKAYLQTDQRGIKIRYLTDIRKDNIYYCKELLKFKHLELRHLEGISVNFGVGDERDCTIHLADEEPEAVAEDQNAAVNVTSLLYTTSKHLVEAQQYLFNTLWNKATSAEDRIKDIEQEIKPAFTETLEGIDQIKKKAFELIRVARQEILAIVSSIDTTAIVVSNAFIGQKDARKEEVEEDELGLIKQAAIHGVNIRIIARNDNPHIKELKEQLASKEQQQLQSQPQQNKIQIQFFQAHFQIKVPTTLVVDRKASLLVELIDEQKPNDPSIKPSMIKRATYSNNEYIVSSYISIFETLWMQNELSTTASKNTKT
jgi:two-component system, OmpR family, sensor histidine kinase VicK